MRTYSAIVRAAENLLGTARVAKNSSRTFKDGQKLVENTWGRAALSASLGLARRADAARTATATTSSLDSVVSPCLGTFGNGRGEKKGRTDPPLPPDGPIPPGGLLGPDGGLGGGGPDGSHGAAAAPMKARAERKIDPVSCILTNWGLWWRLTICVRLGWKDYREFACED